MDANENRTILLINEHTSVKAGIIGRTFSSMGDTCFTDISQVNLE